MVWRDKNHTLFNVPPLWLFLIMEVRGKIRQRTGNPEDSDSQCQYRLNDLRSLFLFCQRKTIIPANDCWAYTPCAVLSHGRLVLTPHVYQPHKAGGRPIHMSYTGEHQSLAVSRQAVKREWPVRSHVISHPVLHAHARQRVHNPRIIFSWSLCVIFFPPGDSSQTQPHRKPV